MLAKWKHCLAIGFTLCLPCQQQRGFIKELCVFCSIDTRLTTAILEATQCRNGISNHSLAVRILGRIDSYNAVTIETGLAKNSLIIKHVGQINALLICLALISENRPTGYQQQLAIIALIIDR